MDLITFQLGLTLRYGERIYQFHRQLDGGQVQFEDQITRHTKTLTIAQAVHDVQEGKALVLREGFDPKLPTSVAPPTSLSDLPMHYQDDLGRKMDYLGWMRRLGINRGEKKRIAEQILVVAERIKDASPPAPNTVMTWMRIFELNDLNPAALVSRYLYRAKTRFTHPLVEEFIYKCLHKHYFTRARNSLENVGSIIRLELKKLVAQGRITEEESKVSASTISRRSKEVEPYFATKARYGDLYARVKFRAPFGVNPIERAMQRYEIDHTTLNWVLICDRTGLPLGRPTLTLVVDRYSSYIVGLHVSFDGPSLSSTLKALKVAIQPKEMYTQHAAYLTNPWLGCGIPEEVAVDNGLEFHSPQFRQVAWELQLILEYCRVRTPWSKAGVERVFRDLDFLHLPSGRVHKPIPNVRFPDPKRDAAIPFSIFCETILKWAVDIHPFHINKHKLSRSFDLFGESLEQIPPPRFLGSLEVLNRIAAMSRYLTVNSGGIELMGLSYSCPELFQMKKEVGPKFKTLVKWDPDDLHMLYVQHPLEHANWVPVPSRTPHYANQLSYVQHRNIRAFAREHFKEIRGQEQLDMARAEMQEMWQSRLIKDHKKLDYKKAVQNQGLSSSKIWMPDQEIITDVQYKPAQPALIIPEAKVTLEEIPDFDGFTLY
jgi:putative transposase